MSVPAAYVRRSYGGGAEPAQLVQEMGTTDTSFGITTTVGWTEEDGSPLGTIGPFCVIIDRFTDTVEKIICTAVNLTTGLVTVDTTGGTGRGADGTTPQSHVPNGSVAGVQTCWTSVEADEANQAVNFMLGQSPTTGEVLTWGASAPEWVAPASGSAGYAQVTTSTTGITAPTAITGLSVTVALSGSQQIKITAYTSQFAATGGALATDQYSVGIYESTTLLNEIALDSGTGGAAIAVLTPTAGSHTYFVQVDHVTGSTAGIFAGAAGAPAFILVEVIS